MALVGYSDSEASDSEAIAPQPSKSSTARPSKPSFQKVVDPSAPRKIKVDLPTLAPEDEAPQDRPAKRARTGGGLSSFNSFLPAPKRTAETAKKGGLGSGVSLRTSAAAAFSREPVEVEFPVEEDVAEGDNPTNQAEPTAQRTKEPVEKPPQPSKPVGNPMKFRPLSVANKKKPKKKVLPVDDGVNGSPGPMGRSESHVTAAPAPRPAKPKVSLFSVTQEDVHPEDRVGDSSYKPLMTTTDPADIAAHDTAAPIEQARANPNSLDAIASDLNLSAQERRRLFGRNARDPSEMNVIQFDTEAEYARNEELRAAGEATEHRAVKAIAPGKHSLQQLVNAASTQKEALEDHWAQGKRNRSEAGSKYGF